MKKLTVLLAFVMLFCSSCTVVPHLAEYEGEGPLPSYMTLLYPGTTSGEYAVLLRSYDKTSSVIALADEIGGEMTNIYTCPDTAAVYEIYAKDGTAAFFEVTAYANGSYGYELNVLETANGEVVHHDNVYSKTVTREGDVQTRFVAVFDGCVYYLTSSVSLERCRIMKYDTKTRALTEYISFPMTENDVTFGHSCTFIKESNGYLICSYIDGANQFIRTYNLRTGNLITEKPLPDNVGVVYCADHDPDTGVYAVYYGALGKNGELETEYLAYSTESDSALHTVYEVAGDVYVCRESVAVCNNLIYFNLECVSEKKPYDGFVGVLYNLTDGKTISFTASCQTWIDGSAVYNLSFAKRQGYDKMILKKTVIE